MQVRWRAPGGGGGEEMEEEGEKGKRVKVLD